MSGVDPEAELRGRHPAATVDRITLANGQRVRTLRWRTTDTDPQRWLLVHGLASNAWLWADTAERLAAAGHEVVAVDQRGHGHSDPPAPADDRYTTPAAADDLAALLDRLGWNDAHLAGQSWGGNVVVEAARRHPDRCRGVTAVDGGLIRLADRFPTWEECATALAPPRLDGRTVEEFTGWIDEVAGHWPPSGRLATLANMVHRDDGTITPHLSFEDHLEVLAGLFAHDPWVSVAGTEVPMAFLLASPTSADDDREALERRLVDLGAPAPRRVEWFLDGHHDLHAEQPDRVAEVLLASVE